VVDPNHVTRSFRVSQTIVQTGKIDSGMEIRLNGDSYAVDGPLTVGELLAQLAIDPRRVAVEVNLVVLKRAAFETTTINEGDEVEIVNFVGGG